MGASASGGKGTDSVSVASRSGTLPKDTDLGYEAIYFNFGFETGQENSKLFYPKISTLVDNDPISNKKDYWLVLGLNSCLDGDGLEKHGGRPPLNIVFCLDNSFSMDAMYDEKTKLQVMKEVMISTLLPQLKGNDCVSITTIFEKPPLQEPQFLNKINLSSVEESISRLTTEGGTSLLKGVLNAEKLFAKQPEGGKHESRFFLLTDAIPTDDDASGKLLFEKLKKFAVDGIYTTIIGIGKDFNTKLTEKLSEISGLNWFAISSPSSFKETMDRDFSFLMTIAFSDLSMTLDPNSPFTVERVFGSPGNEIPDPGVLLQMNLCSPSFKESQELTKGGIIVAKLNIQDPTRISEPVKVGITYKTTKKEEIKDEVIIKFDENSKEIFARKGVLLTRYVSLMKNYIRDVRKFESQKVDDPSFTNFSATITSESGIVSPGPQKPDGVIELIIPLKQIPGDYHTILSKFKAYYEEEATNFEDLSGLIKEIHILELILEKHTANEKHSTVSIPKTFDWSSRDESIKSKIAEFQKNNREKSIQFIKNTVDICFLLDCTGSMGSWINTCKDQIKSIVSLITKTYPTYKLRISFVGYRDIASKSRFAIKEFTEDAESVKDFISGVAADGGDDIPEDICGGLRKALDLKWEGEKKLIILIADAPCHGRIFHDEHDSYPDGDPNGLEPEVLMAEMIQYGIQFYFSNITDSTDKMVSLWNKFYSNNNGFGWSLKTFDIKKSADFLPNISDSIGSVIELHA